MCKISVGLRKSDIKVISRKKRKNMYDKLQQAFIDGLNELKSLSGNRLAISNLDQGDNEIRREKSRTAAKERRFLENEKLNQLYCSLPVSAQSRLLSCDDSHFIGFFEKTTIIKVSAYILKLYNSLSASNRLPVLGANALPSTSLLSQTLSGVFWCEESNKIIFVTPGLARLTGLFWCNIIGMPMNSLFIDFDNKIKQENRSKLVFMRIMKTRSIGRGIFNVQQCPTRAIQNEEISDDTRQSSYSHLIGRMPCSVWISGQIGHNVRYEIIHPLNSISTDINNLVYIYSNGRNNSGLPSHDDISMTMADNGTQTSAYFDIDNFGIIAAEKEFLLSLGFTAGELYDANIYNFFHFDDLQKICTDLEIIMKNRSEIRQSFIRIYTAQRSTFLFCQCTVYVNGEQELNIPYVINSRSSTTQGEAYAQNVMDALNSMDRDEDGNFQLGNNMMNSYIHLSILPVHLSTEDSDELGEVESAAHRSMEQDEDSSSNTDNLLLEPPRIETYQIVNINQSRPGKEYELLQAMNQVPSTVPALSDQDTLDGIESITNSTQSYHNISNNNPLFSSAESITLYDVEYDQPNNLQILGEDQSSYESQLGITRTMFTSENPSTSLYENVPSLYAPNYDMFQDNIPMSSDQSMQLFEQRSSIYDPELEFFHPSTSSFPNVVDFSQTQNMDPFTANYNYLQRISRPRLCKREEQESPSRRFRRDRSPPRNAVINGRMNPLYQVCQSPHCYDVIQCNALCQEAHCTSFNLNCNALCKNNHSIYGSYEPSFHSNEVCCIGQSNPSNLDQSIQLVQPNRPISEIPRESQRGSRTSSLPESSISILMQELMKP